MREDFEKLIDELSHKLFNTGFEYLDATLKDNDTVGDACNIIISAYVSALLNTMRVLASHDHEDTQKKVALFRKDFLEFLANHEHIKNVEKF